MTRSNAAWWVLAALLVVFLWRFGQLASYLLGAIALSFAGRPVVRWIASRRVGSKTLGHGLGAATTLALMVALLTGVVLALHPAPRPTSRHVVPSRFRAAHPSLERPFENGRPVHHLGGFERPRAWPTAPTSQTN